MQIAKDTLEDKRQKNMDSCSITPSVTIRFSNKGIRGPCTRLILDFN